MHEVSSFTITFVWRSGESPTLHSESRDARRYLQLGSSGKRKTYPFFFLLLLQVGVTKTAAVETSLLLSPRSWRGEMRPPGREGEAGTRDETRGEGGGGRERHRVEVREGSASARGRGERREEGGGGGGAAPSSPSPPPPEPAALGTWSASARLSLQPCALLLGARLFERVFAPFCFYRSLSISFLIYRQETITTKMNTHTLPVINSHVLFFFPSLHGAPPSTALSALSAPTSARCSRSQHLHLRAARCEHYSSIHSQGNLPCICTLCVCVCV